MDSKLEIYQILDKLTDTIESLSVIIDSLEKRIQALEATQIRQNTLR